MDNRELSSPSKEAISPLGVSRYGRTRKPKISADFCHIDEALISDVTDVINKSPTKSPKLNDIQKKIVVKTSLDKQIKLKIKTEMQADVETIPIVEVSDDIKNEGLKVLNDVFESSPIDDVLKIIASTKSADINVGVMKKRSPQQLRTYVNKRKIVVPQSRVIESFGLPDDPIVPMYEEKLVFKPFKDLDVDESVPENVTLVDDFLTNILKDDNGFENGDLNRNKENERNSYKNLTKSKSPHNMQYNNLSNGLLLFDKKYKNVKESLGNSQSSESIEKIVESFTESEGNLLVEEHKNNCSNDILKVDNHEINSNVQMDHTYFNMEDKLDIDIKNNLLKPYEIKDKEAKENGLVISIPQTKEITKFHQRNEIMKIKDNVDKKSEFLNKIEEFPEEITNDQTDKINSNITQQKSNVTEGQEIKKDNLKIDEKYGAISYEHLENFENCLSEDDTIPLSKLRNRIKTKAPAKLKNTTNTKKDKKEVANEVFLDEKVRKYPNTRLSKGKSEISSKNGNESTGIDVEESKDIQGKSTDEEKIKGVRKMSDTNVKSPITKKKNKSTSQNIEFEVSIGQLMWAKVGTFPYWPCMIANEPESNKFVKNLSNRKLCHLRFFGDRGRRAWISKKQLLPYCSLAELQKNPNISRNDIKVPSRSFRYKTSWTAAIEEANTLKNKNLQEKVAFFEKILEEQDKIKEEKKLQKRVEMSNKRKQTIQQVQDIKEEKVAVIHPKRSTRNSDNSKLESSPKRKKPNEEDLESDSESEISLQGFPSNMEEQIALYKRNNLFKKVTRERVCQVCLKLGVVWRCKGRCQSFYHVECAEKNYIKQSVIEIKEDVQIQDSDHLKIDKIDDLINNEIIMSTNEKQVEIISIKDRKRLTPTNLTLTNDIMFKKLPLFEQIDQKMTEVMKDFNDKALYLESTTDCSTEESSVESTPEKPKTIKNDEISVTNDKKVITELFCKNCLENNDPLCFVCNKEISKNNLAVRQRCSWMKCGKFYHPECLKLWPQTQWSVSTVKKHKVHSNSNEFICPMHICHTCVSDDPRAPFSRCYSDKLVKCVYCPSTYHMATYCVPAGSQILSSTQIICPKHENLRRSSNKHSSPINTTWCFICSEGGTLICCETCPTSVHADCLDIKYTDDDKFICEDCETGRFPLYDEIVWVKFGSYRWWPAVILYPNEIPEKVKKRNHNPGEFVVKFFGTYDHYWISKGRVFLFQEGDTGGGGTTKRKMEEIFKRSIEEATSLHLLKKEFKESILREAEGKSKYKPPLYVKIKVNRPVGNVRQFDGNISNTTPCECDPKKKNPCGPDSDCLNRLLLTECDPTVCPAGDKCQNQNFELRNYPDLIPYKTEARGWGLQSLQSLQKGQFVIEYVGEMIDEPEYQRRIRQMHELKEENYYFLTIDKDRMIDAGPKGNLARFMNHSCQPNCETQKWTVNGDTRVGLFAMDDIPANTELTFNYNLECVGKEKKICKCGAPNCSGFIGLKVKQGTETKAKVKTKKFKKKRSPTPIVQEQSEPCFVCGSQGDVRSCDNKICSKFYHPKCIGLEIWPEGKWVCPWHNCKICLKRTIRCCVKCLNSYCPKHSQGNIRHDKSLGFICSIHDPRKIHPLPMLEIKTEEIEVTSTVADLPEEIEFPLVDPLNISTEIDGVVTSTPYKSDTSKSKRLNKRKRSRKLLDTRRASKKGKSEKGELRKSASGDSSRTLRSATVNSSSDNMKLKLKA